MSLDDEIKEARKEIKSDGYEMSIGEVINLYRDGELTINPEYQRLFRWDITRKTRFIESLLLGIPIPPIFVFQGETRKWELIDGLQRLSTILQFIGILEPKDYDPLVLEGTNYLPSLEGCTWEAHPEKGFEKPIGEAPQIQIKRSRLRVEILQPESDVTAKFELFQRLNTGGANLSEQEIRNSVAVMIDKDFLLWLKELAIFPAFQVTTAQTESALESQKGTELALRLLAFRLIPYVPGLDVHEYLDQALIKIASDESLDRESLREDFFDTFSFLDDALGERAFKRWDGAKFSGKFLMSVFEVMGHGVHMNIANLRKLDPQARRQFLVAKAQELWGNEAFDKNSGGGVRGTTRLANLLPMSEDFLRP